MIRTVIVDDDIYTIRNLERILEKFFASDLLVLASIDDSKQAVQFLKNNQVDLLFLDIQMPEITGFDLLDDQIETPNVIFITSYNEYAIKAIRYSAFDYLLKPLSESMIFETVKRFLNPDSFITQIERLKTLRFNLQQKEISQFKLLLPSRQGTYTFLSKDIIRCTADSNYTELILNGNKKFVSSKTLGDIELMLPNDSFIRVHKSHIINIEYAERFLKSSSEILLTNGERIPVSRRRAVEINDKLNSLNSDQNT